jgi:heme/copper-type cytochrome/quinol oxidase subunit 1
MVLEFLKNRHYFLLLLASILFLVLSLTINKNEMMDINIHDTYYVITFQHAYILFSLILFITGLNYLIFNFFKVQFNLILSLSHVYSSLVFIGLFFYYLNRANSVKEFPLFDSIDYNSRTIISLLIFVGLQLLFVFNILLKLSSFFLKSTSK